MDLTGITRDGLVEYLARQVDHFFPDGATDARKTIGADLDEALDRMNRCVNAVRMWPEDKFNYLHSEQNTIFLYYLANTIWRNRSHENVCSKLFYLNKTLNGFHCFYDTPMPERFFIGHSLGIVLVRTDYPEYMVLYQNCTVGKNHGEAPTLGRGLVMYPGSAVIGPCQVGENTVLAQGCSVINTDTPGNCYVFRNGTGLTFKPPKRDVLRDIFRL